MLDVCVFDPTKKDTLSKVRGIGRYLQILKENFPDWHFSSQPLTTVNSQRTTFINPFFNFLSPPLFIRRKFPKQIAVIHDLIPLKYPEHFPIGLKGNIVVLLNKIALSSYDIVISDSVQSKNDIVTILHIPENKVKVVYPCLPNAFYEKSQTNPTFQIPNSKFLLYVGDATWNKNLVKLARAIKMQEIPCVFVGKIFNTVNKINNSVGGECLRDPDSAEQSEHWREKNIRQDPQNNPWQKELHDFISLAQRDKRFIFPGYISDEELIGLYQKALCNILVSRDEGFGFSYLEASSQQCPSILSDIPVLREISDNNALFVNASDPTLIAKAIRSVEADAVFHNKLSKQSLKRSVFFSPEQFKDGFLSLLA